MPSINDLDLIFKVTEVNIGNSTLVARFVIFAPVDF